MHPMWRQKRFSHHAGEKEEENKIRSQNFFNYIFIYRFQKLLTAEEMSAGFKKEISQIYEKLWAFLSERNFPHGSGAFFAERFGLSTVSIKLVEGPGF